MAAAAADFEAARQCLLILQNERAAYFHARVMLSRYTDMMYISRRAGLIHYA